MSMWFKIVKTPFTECKIVIVFTYFIVTVIEKFFSSLIFHWSSTRPAPQIPAASDLLLSLSDTEGVQFIPADTDTKFLKVDKGTKSLGRDCPSQQILVQAQTPLNRKNEP